MADKSILLVEDDPDIASLLSRNVVQLGHAIDSVADGESGLERFQHGNYSLVILDVGLPGLNGFEVCKRLRAMNTQVPIMFLTAQSDEIDRILGLELGADDYICKPFGIRECLARINALLRRMERMPAFGGTEKKSTIYFLDMEINVEAQTVRRGGNIIALTAAEYDFLVHLAAAAGKPKSRDELLHSVWGYASSGYEQIITCCVSRLRKKIEDDPEKPRFVQTVRGVGYRFGDPFGEES